MNEFFLAGLLMSQTDTIVEAVEEGNKKNALTVYDWSDSEFTKSRDKIVDDFYKGHPDMTLGDGQFNTRYPEKKKGIDVINRMSEMNRILPDEYLLLLKEILNF